MTERTVLKVDKLAKTFRKPFTGKKVQAVRDVSFEVLEGHIFGFLGPNGAGKTTTIKMLTGLIAPTGGQAALLGEPIPSPEAMGRVGFLPESPYVYPYLTPKEFVSLCGRLNGLSGHKLHERVAHVLERVGMTYAMDRPVRNLSKGMLQRVGLAAALVHEPELLILDEPMSGLDPVGRKEVRDLIVEEKHAGRTVFFSSHILTDVEMLCDHVCILRKGEVVALGAIRDLLKDGSHHAEITLRDVNAELVGELRAMTEAGQPVRVEQAIGGATVVQVEGDESLNLVLSKALAKRAHVESVQPKRQTLEAIFVDRAL